MSTALLRTIYGSRTAHMSTDIAVDLAFFPMIFLSFLFSNSQLWGGAGWAERAGSAHARNKFKMAGGPVQERNQGEYHASLTNYIISLVFRRNSVRGRTGREGLRVNTLGAVLTSGSHRYAEWWSHFSNDSAVTVANVHVPRDRISQTHQGYGFVEFMSEEDADYAIKIMNMIKLYGRPVRVNKVSL